MTAINLRKALQKKNKLVGEVANLRRLVAKNNTTVYRIVQPSAATETKQEEMVVNKPSFDVLKLNDELSDKVEKLIALKAEIAKANVPIYEKIARVSELKSAASALQNIPCNEGIQESYNDTLNRVECVISEAAIILKTKEIEEAIEKLQDEIDHYNSNTVIEVDL